MKFNDKSINNDLVWKSCLYAECQDFLKNDNLINPYIQKIFLHQKDKKHDF